MEILTERLNREAISTKKLENLIASNSLDSFFDDVKKYDIFKEDVMNFYMIAFSHQLLTALERFKKYLLATLDKKSLGLNKNPSLGEIFVKLQFHKINHRFDEIMDNKLRNALGHSSYYWKNNNFYYIIDSEYQRTKELTLGELFVIMRKASLVSNAFTYSAFDHILEIQRKKSNFINEPKVDKKKI